MFSFRLRRGATNITTVLLDRIPSSAVPFMRTCCVYPRSGREQIFPQKPRSIFTRLHGVVSQKAAFIVTNLSCMNVRVCFIPQEEDNL